MRLSAVDAFARPALRWGAGGELQRCAGVVTASAVALVSEEARRSVVECLESVCAMWVADMGSERIQRAPGAHLDVSGSFQGQKTRGQPPPHVARIFRPRIQGNHRVSKPPADDNPLTLHVKHPVRHGVAVSCASVS